MVTELPISPRSFSDPEQAGGLFAVQARGSAEGEKPLRKSCPGRGVGGVPEEAEDVRDYPNPRLGNPQLPEQKVPFLGADLPGGSFRGELSLIPGQADVIAQVSEFQVLPLRFW